jgi:hypothetical protein
MRQNPEIKFREISKKKRKAVAGQAEVVIPNQVFPQFVPRTWNR